MKIKFKGIFLLAIVVLLSLNVSAASYKIDNNRGSFEYGLQFNIFGQER